MLIEIGKKAPAFNLTDKTGAKIALKDIDTDYTIVYFYPKDNTSGCTLEAKGFEALKAKFKRAGVSVIGISGGTDKTKENFAKKQDLTISLLSDTDFAISTKYGVYGEKKFMGKTYMGISRITYLLDKDKKVIKRYDKVKPISHAKEVLDDIKSL